MLNLNNIKSWLWIIDKFISVTFMRNKIMLNRGIPSEIWDICEQSYDTARAKVIAFKTNLLFEKNSELRVTKNELNALLKPLFVDYKRQKLADRSFSISVVHSIDHEEIILDKLFPFLFFNLEPLVFKETIKFELNNGEIDEYVKTPWIDHESGKYKYLVKNKDSSNLIFYILGLPPADQNQQPFDESYLFLSKKASAPFISKLKKIKVIDNELILE